MHLKIICKLKREMLDTSLTVVCVSNIRFTSKDSNWPHIRPSHPKKQENLHATAPDFCLFAPDLPTAHTKLHTNGSTWLITSLPSPSLPCYYICSLACLPAWASTNHRAASMFTNIEQSGSSDEKHPSHMRESKHTHTHDKLVKYLYKSACL